MNFKRIVPYVKQKHLGLGEFQVAEIWPVSPREPRPVARPSFFEPQSRQVLVDCGFWILYTFCSFGQQAAAACARPFSLRLQSSLSLLTGRLYITRLLSQNHILCSIMFMDSVADQLRYQARTGGASAVAYQCRHRYDEKWWIIRNCRCDDVMFIVIHIVIQMIQHSSLALLIHDQNDHVRRRSDALGSVCLVECPTLVSYCSYTFGFTLWCTD